MIFEDFSLFSRSYIIEKSWIMPENKVIQTRECNGFTKGKLMMHPKTYVALCIHLKDWDRALDTQKEINHVNIKQQGWTFDAIRLDNIMQMRINNCLAFSIKVIHLNRRLNEQRP